MKILRINKIVLFWGLLFLILYTIKFLVDYGVRKSTYDRYYKVNLISNHQIDPQIACFGSSVGEVAVDAPLISRRTGQSMYNFSIDGTRFMQYKGLIQELNEYSQNCKLVILAETIFSLSNVNQLTEVDRYMAHISNNNIYEALYQVQPDVLWKLKHVPFYSFIVAKNSYYKASLIGYKNAIERIDYNDSLSGFIPVNKSWQPGLDSLNKKTKSIYITIDSTVLGNYRKMIASLHAKGRKILIIIPPINKDALELLPNLWVLRKAFESLQAEGVYFRDYSASSISSDKKYFYNNTHLNKEGAEIFSLSMTGIIGEILNKTEAVSFKKTPPF